MRSHCRSLIEQFSTPAPPPSFPAHSKHMLLDPWNREIWTRHVEHANLHVKYALARSSGRTGRFNFSNLWQRPLQNSSYTPDTSVYETTLKKSFQPCKILCDAHLPFAPGRRLRVKPVSRSAACKAAANSQFLRPLTFSSIKAPQEPNAIKAVQRLS